MQSSRPVFPALGKCNSKGSGGQGRSPLQTELRLSLATRDSVSNIHTHRTQNTTKIHTQKAPRNGKRVSCFSSDPVPKGGCGHGAKDGSKSSMVTAKPPVQRSPEAAGWDRTQGTFCGPLPGRGKEAKKGGEKIQDCLNAMYIFTYSRRLKLSQLRGHREWHSRG